MVASKKKTGRLKKAALITGGTLLLLPVTAWFSAPSIIKWYVPRKIPGATISDVELHLDGTAQVFGARLKRDGLKASASRVHVDLRNRSVDVKKGSIDLDLDKFHFPRKAQSKKQSRPWSIQASGIDARVKKGNIVSDIQNAALKGEELCFESAAVKHPQAIRLEIKNGCVSKSKRGHFNFVELEAKLPVKIPHIKEHQLITISDLSFDYPKRSLSFGAADFTNYGEQDEHSIVSVGKVKISSEIVAVKAESISTIHKWLSPNHRSLQPWIVINVDLTFPRKGDVIVLGVEGWNHNRIEVKVNKRSWHVTTKGGECANWLASMTTNSNEPHNYQDMSGVFEFDIGLKPPKLNIHNTCKMSCGNEVISGLKSEFSYVAIDEDGEQFERKTGPRSMNWTPLVGVASEVHEAVIMMEDPGFEYHRGYLRLALLNSLKANLDAGKFVRGGSTITMQLVKNIWLGRAKTLDRKLREIILSKMLEGCLSKYEIIELYLNVVEFGPGIYGIGAASKHYFEKSPDLLEPDEAMFLARVLPHPSRVTPPEKGGMKRVHKLMKKLQKLDKLPEEFDIGLDDEEAEDNAAGDNTSGGEPEVRKE